VHGQKPHAYLGKNHNTPTSGGAECSIVALAVLGGDWPKEQAAPCPSRAAHARKPSCFRAAVVVGCARRAPLARPFLNNRRRANWLPVHLTRWVDVSCSRPSRSLFPHDVDDVHHALILVVQDVAVDDLLSSVSVELLADSHRIAIRPFVGSTSFAMLVVLTKALAESRGQNERVVPVAFLRGGEERDVGAVTGWAEWAQASGYSAQLRVSWK